ncbi:REF/SRPP-like protein At1g67360 [Vigna unguiculata]|uniref:REF/SRPP-like protein At1g67360 n=1 Tax=Vigna unguiculata TaxID=3917 RepID=UPI001015CB04|nr:REF/SRPP-like protein At1g67360 [Vigna unguiculata]
MATTTERDVENKSHEGLKHLGFVKIAAIKGFVCVSNLYDFAKQNSGPLRSAVGTVEDTVTTVLGPVYSKFKGVPNRLLLFVDNKVDEATHKFDEHAPSLVKQVASQANCLVQEMTNKAEKVVSEAQSGGARAAAQYVATESKKIVAFGSVKLWCGLNHYPPFHAVAEMAVPTAAHWSEKYNNVVKGMSKKGGGVFSYLPLIPTDDIAKAFKQGGGYVIEDEAGSEGENFS